jgi:putative Ca2+/H+ antiporter (TMEM165/GDT1 family)
MVKTLVMIGVVIGLIFGFTASATICHFTSKSLHKEITNKAEEIVLLKEAIKLQNTAVEDLKEFATKKMLLAEEAREQARQRNINIEKQLGILSSADGKTCEEADQLINEVFGL